LCYVNVCDGVTLLAEMPVDFNYQTPRAPKDYANPREPKRNGVKLITYWDPGLSKLRCVHYDWFVVRVFEAAADRDTWRIIAAQHRIHAEREDVEFPKSWL
jgi:hypothetical protein